MVKMLDDICIHPREEYKEFLKANLKDYPLRERIKRKIDRIKKEPFVYGVLPGFRYALIGAGIVGGAGAIEEYGFPEGSPLAAFIFTLFTTTSLLWKLFEERVREEYEINIHK